MLGSNLEATADMGDHYHLVADNEKHQTIHLTYRNTGIAQYWKQV